MIGHILHSLSAAFFTLGEYPFEIHTLEILIKEISIFPFVVVALGLDSRNNQDHKLLCLFSSQSYIVLAVTIRSLIHLR